MVAPNLSKIGALIVASAGGIAGAETSRRPTNSMTRPEGVEVIVIYLSGRLKADEIGRRKDIGLMLSYRAGSLSHGRTHLENVLWAADNGCFTRPNLDAEAYLQWLRNLLTFQETCLFATAPDVVGDAVATWKRAKDVLPKIRALGYAAAFVAQDGIENLSVQWDSFDCLFIGGTTTWKLSGQVAQLCREAQREGKWIHMGRVNSYRRMCLAAYWNVQSVDGTGLAFAPDRKLEQLERWLDLFHGVARYNAILKQPLFYQGQGSLIFHDIAGAETSRRPTNSMTRPEGGKC